METVSIVLFLLLAVVVSGAVSRMLPVSLPTPLVQIVLGAVIGLSTSYRVELDPELFLLLFLPPLLFLDGWRIPKDELLKDVSTVVELALGLVLLTVIGMGFFIHWLIPAMPMAVAFALAAVVSPTDPIAVSAIAARVPIPKRMMHTRECLAIHVDQGIKGEQVVDVMDRLLFERGSPPAKIRVDNGPEFISRALDHWAYINRVTPDFSRPGKPTYTDVVEKPFQPGAGIFFERELARSGQSGHTDWARSGLCCRSTEACCKNTEDDLA